MRRIGLFAFLFLTILTLQSSLAGCSTVVADVSNYGNMNDTHEISKIMDPPQPAITDVFPNPSFERYTSDGALEDWDVNDPGYYGVNVSAHDLVHGGTNSCLMFAMGSPYEDEYARMHRYIDDENLNDGLSIEFFFYLKSIPDLATGAQIYFYVTSQDSAGPVCNQYYYLSYGSNPRNNYTGEVVFLMNSTTGGWIHFNRNITQDFQNSPTLPALTLTREVTQVVFYIDSPKNASGVTELILDDAEFLGAEYPTQNSDFETGGYWVWENGGKWSLGPSLDCTDGQYSLNISCSTDSVVSINQRFDNTHGFYGDAPGDLILEFDWKYSDSDLPEGGERCFLFLSATTGSVLIYIYYYLGANADVVDALFSSKFDAQGQWIHERLDLYTLFLEYGLTGNYGVNHYQFMIKGGTEEDSNAELLLDDIRLWTYPLGDPGFEEDWYPKVAHDPLTSWINTAGDNTTISLSDTAHTGNHAANLTDKLVGQSEIRRDIPMPIDPMLHTDFWWRLEHIQAEGPTKAGISLSFEGGYELNYLVANGSSTLTNTSTSGWIKIDNCNTTGMWFNIARNISDDLDTLFSQQKWNLTSVELTTYTENGNISVLFDDMHFIDYSPPIIESVSIDPSTPMCYESVNITVVAHDLGRIDEVVLKYSLDNGTTWTPVDSFIVPGGFIGTIPPVVYNTLVNISIVVKDSNGNQVSQYFTYIPDDVLAPVITPHDDTTIEAWSTIESITWEFVEHSPDRYRLLVDDVEIKNGLFFGSSIEISINLEKGTHTCTLILTDLAGNSDEDIVQITAVDTTAPELNHPMDIQYLVGVTGSMIFWTPSEPDPGAYEIRQNGVVLIAGTWDGRDISIDVDGLGPGVYEYILTVYDMSGNNASDTVIVTVTADNLYSMMTFLSFTGGAVIVIIIVVVIIRKRKS